jgi:hypothetical protein
MDDIAVGHHENGKPKNSQQPEDQVMDDVAESYHEDGIAENLQQPKTSELLPHPISPTPAYDALTSRLQGIYFLAFQKLPLCIVLMRLQSVLAVIEAEHLDGKLHESIRKGCPMSTSSWKNSKQQ